MSTQVPSIGRIVHYKLSENDAAQINRRRTTSASIAERMAAHIKTDAGVVDAAAWPAGAQAHIGNAVAEGDVFPMLITRTWGSEVTSAVNGQVFLDGNDTFWATSRVVGEQAGTFSWPTRS